MKVLVVALDGQIRSALSSQFDRRHRDYVCVGREWLDTVSTFDFSDIGVVVNALSFECLEQGADESLIDDLSTLSQACNQAGIAIIHLSSSQVFDGAEEKRKSETDDVIPTGDVGVLSGRMEVLVADLCRQSLILRTGPLFSAQGDNLLTRLLRQFESGQSVLLSKKGKNCPVHTMDLARVISAIIDQLSCVELSWGIYHYCSSDSTSSYQFGETVLAVASQYVAADQPLIIEQVELDDNNWSLPQLDCEKIFHTFGIKQLPWRAFITPTVKEVFGES